MERSAFLPQLLELLSANKSYPKYQHERRIDIFFNFFLPAVLEAVLGTSIDLVVPEFPLKKPESRRSTNADYLAFSARDKAVFLCEFRTTAGSFRKAQMDRYFQAQRAKWPALREDVEQVFAGAARHDKEKYRRLLDKVRDIPRGVTIKVLYIAPAAIRLRLDAAAAGRRYEFIALEELRSLEVATAFKDEWSLVRSSL
jgi:hypothetical protein